MCKQQPKSWYYCRILGSGFGWITDLFCRILGSSFCWITDLFLQDSWILCLRFRDDRHLRGTALGDHLPPRTQSQHQETQVRFWSAGFRGKFLRVLIRFACTICSQGPNFFLKFNPRIMLVLAWLAAPVCSLPQSFIFRVKTHPILHEYRYLGWTKNFWSQSCILLNMKMRITNTEPGYELWLSRCLKEAPATGAFLGFYTQ